MNTPTKWSEITVGQFSKIQAAITLEKDLMEQSILILSILKNVKPQDIDRLTIAQINKELSAIDFVKTEEISKKIFARFKVKGRTFRACLDISQIETGQYMDLMEFCKKDVLHNIHNIMAVLCTEVKGWRNKPVKYTGQVHQERALLFYENLSIEVAYPQALFFCKVWENLIPAMEIYSERKQKRMTEILTASNNRMLKSQIHITNNGDGTSRSTTSAEATALNGMSTKK